MDSTATMCYFRRHAPPHQTRHTHVVAAACGSRASALCLEPRVSAWLYHREVNFEADRRVDRATVQEGLVRVRVRSSHGDTPGQRGTRSPLSAARRATPRCNTTACVRPAPSVNLPCHQARKPGLSTCRATRRGARLDDGCGTCGHGRMWALCLIRKICLFDLWPTANVCLIHVACPLLSRAGSNTTTYPPGRAQL